MHALPPHQRKGERPTAWRKEQRTENASCDSCTGDPGRVLVILSYSLQSSSCHGYKGMSCAQSLFMACAVRVCLQSRLKCSVQNLTKLLGDHAPGCCREQKIDNYFGRRIAIDASMHIYQFLVGISAGICWISTVCLHGLAHRVNEGRPADGQVVVGRTGDQTLTSESGDVTRYTSDRRLISGSACASMLC